MRGGYEAVELTVAHKASGEAEKARITAAGGMVMRGRIFGDLSVSRAMGDADYKVPKQSANYVSAEPHLSSHDLIYEKHDFLIMASDGLWDKVSPQEAVAMVGARKADLNPSELSALLLDEALKRGSSDNLTAVVVLFDWRPKETTVRRYSSLGLDDGDEPLISSADSTPSTSPRLRPNATYTPSSSSPSFSLQAMIFSSQSSPSSKAPLSSRPSTSSSLHEGDNGVDEEVASEEKKESPKEEKVEKVGKEETVSNSDGASPKKKGEEKKVESKKEADVKVAEEASESPSDL